MKDIVKKISFSLLTLLSIIAITSCEDNEDGVTNPNEMGSEVTARFTKSKEGKTISFINISENATTYMWDLGDGTTSTLINPEKRYVNGTYTVTLTASNDQGESNTSTSTILIDGCVDETDENRDPAAGDLNMTFLNTDGKYGKHTTTDYNPTIYYDYEGSNNPKIVQNYIGHEGHIFINTEPLENIKDMQTIDQFEIDYRPKFS